MNLLNFKIVRIYIKLCLFILSFFCHVQIKAIDVDFSRRTKDLKSLRLPASIVDQPVSKTEIPWNSKVVQPVGPEQDIVILSTKDGFVPSTIKIKKGYSYKVHVVNINAQSKNTSYILEAFSENHSTFYGEQKTFTIAPKQDGAFAFLCPENGKQGRFVVFSDEETGSEKQKRRTAAEE